MYQPLRTSSAASLVVLASILAGCAGPQAETGANPFAHGVSAVFRLAV